MKKTLVVSEPSLGELESLYVGSAVASGWVSSLGSYIEKFEDRLEVLSGKKYNISTSNGTTALHLALLALGVSPGDEVVVTDWTFIAPINAILYCGATPVLSPVSLEYGMPLVSTLLDLITPKTKAVIIVHPYGKVFPTNKLVELLPSNIAVVEDCAEAHGARYTNGNVVGSAGVISTFSFYGNKIMTTGEGGAVCTNSELYDAEIRKLRDHAMCSDRRYFHTSVGYNYRMTNMQAALGCAQLERLDEMLSRRSDLFECYREALSDCERIKFLSDMQGVSPVNWLTTIFIDGYKRSDVALLGEELNRHGIQTRPVFYSASSFEYLDNICVKCDSATSVQLSDEGISLPTHLGVSHADVERVSGLIKDMCK